jgi:hypothetical protein
MLKFHKWAVYFPDPIPLKPPINDEDRRKMAADPPIPTPLHCKPWVDGQTLGWTLSYGYLSPMTLVDLGDNQFEIRDDEQLMKERSGEAVIGRFADTHFGFASGYILQTPPGFVTYIAPTKNAPANLRAIEGVVETDWYPRSIFFVFETPARDEVIKLDYGDELVRVIIVPRHQKMQAEPLTETELAAVYTEQDRYKAEKATSPTIWTAANGLTFDHVYKQWSKDFVRQLAASDQPDFRPKPTAHTDSAEKPHTS